MPQTIRDYALFLRPCSGRIPFYAAASTEVRPTEAFQSLLALTSRSIRGRRLRVLVRAGACWDADSAVLAMGCGD
jgi:hypothetical protein